MRGKAVCVLWRADSVGITPAYAGKRQERPRQQTSNKDYPRVCGKSAPEKPRTSGSGDHPRVCGEKNDLPAVHDRSLGSPPRMRGKDGLRDDAQRYRGITPAYAGKSSPSCCGSWRCMDHPRVCGEKAGKATAADIKQGSPPRMRGKGRKGHGSRHQTRITPAYAGKSL